LSRLDSAIRRLLAQRACLELAAELIAGLPGPVLELGLGNGRSYDHLRERLPEREIFVFERCVAAHPDCVPDAAHLFLGDFRDSLPAAARRLGATAALAHADFGSGEKAPTAALAAWLPAALSVLLRDGAVVASDQALAHPGLAAQPLPNSVPGGRYHLYRWRPA
jgi:hypothetical protein